MGNNLSLSIERKAFANWISNQCNWQIFATLTFRKEVSEQYGYRYFRGFCQKLAREYLNEHIWVFYGYAPQQRGVYHFHATFGFRNDSEISCSPAFVERLWPYNSKVEKFLPAKGGLEYIAKHKHYDFNVACPRPSRCRRTKRGCIVASVIEHRHR